MKRLAAIVLAAVVVALPVGLPVEAAPPAGSPLGTNLAAVTDFTASYPFVDVMKHARPWFSGVLNGTFDDGRSLKRDKRGNVKKLKSGQVARTVLFTGLPSDPTLGGRQLIVRYSGKGRLSYAGAVTTISQAPGRDVIELDHSGIVDNEVDEATVIITLESTNKRKPLRDIRITGTGGICDGDPFTEVDDAADCLTPDAFRSYEANVSTIRFDPLFLSRLTEYRSFRFMDWMRTNDSGQGKKFKKRARTSHQFWSTGAGVPLEVMIDLANRMDIDPWFNIPHRASDKYVKSFAKVVNASLEAGRVAHIEYSNEVWNGIFGQTAYATARGLDLGLDSNPTEAMLKFYSRRAQQVFDIFTSIFVDDARLKRVMATQAVVPSFTETILGYGSAAAKTDAFAIAPYFGETIDSQTQADEIKALEASDGIFDWLNNGGNANLPSGDLVSNAAAVQAQFDVVDALNIPLIAYEGGQHFVAIGAFQSDADLNAILDSINRDPRIKDIYATYLLNWQNITGQPFWHFTHCDRWSEHGRWGSLELPGQDAATAPKFDALQTFIAAHPLP